MTTIRKKWQRGSETEVSYILSEASVYHTTGEYQFMERRGSYLAYTMGGGCGKPKAYGVRTQNLPQSRLQNEEGHVIGTKCAPDF